jgi:hypothetical protein
MKTYFVATVVINRQNGGHLEFPIFTKFLPSHPLTYTNPYAEFQMNPSLVEREREKSTDADM